MNKTLHKGRMDTNWMPQLIIAGKYRLYRHLLLIVFTIIVLYYSPPDYIEPFETYSRTVIFFLILLLAYSNMYFFVPKFLLRKKYLSYGLLVLACIIISFFIHEISSRYLRPYLLPYEDDNINFFTFSFMIMVLIIASAAVKLFQQWISDAQLIHNLELAQLKNQITPHFLFNMLNNANVLTEDDPKKGFTGFNEAKRSASLSTL